MENQEQKIESPFVTPEQAAAMLQISLTSVYRHLNNGSIKSRRIGRLFRIEKKYLEQLATM